MGYFKEQQIERMSHQLEDDPFAFLRKQVQRVERAATIQAWWLEEKVEDPPVKNETLEQPTWPQKSA